MGKSSQKQPRKKFDPKKFSAPEGPPVKKEKDWSFEDIARSKTHRH